MNKLKLLIISLLAILTLSNVFADTYEDMEEAITIEDASWVRQILENEEYNVNTTTVYGTSALIMAVNTGNFEIFELILSDKEIDVNSADFFLDYTALMFAVTNGRIRIAATLIKYPGIDLNYEDEYGETALSLAKENNLNGIVRLINKKLNTIKEESHQFLGLCRAGNNLDAIKLALKSEFVDINYRSSTGMSALVGATIEGKDKVVEILLKQKDLDVNIKDQGDWTALMYAAYYGHLEIAKQLLNQDYIHVNNTGKGGSTALQQAVNRGHNDIARLILADPRLN